MWWIFSMWLLKFIVIHLSPLFAYLNIEMNKVELREIFKHSNIYEKCIFFISIKAVQQLMSDPLHVMQTPAAQSVHFINTE